MPVLVTKYRNLVYVARLKKSYTTIENGFQKMLADDGVQYLSDTTAFNSITKIHIMEDLLLGVVKIIYVLCLLLI